MLSAVYNSPARGLYRSGGIYTPGPHGNFWKMAITRLNLEAILTKSGYKMNEFSWK